ncbi:MAG: reverse transcriptase domain-containing protein, partial [Flavobacteriales bacterium]
YKLYEALVENQTGLHIKSFRSDNGGEYIADNFQQHLAQQGTLFQPSAPHTPEHNGVAERKNRTLVEMARCMLQTAKLPHSFWAEAVCTANYIVNRTPTRTLDNISPYEKWTGESPSLSNLRIFGCHAYALIDKRKKLDPKSQLHIYLGPSINGKDHKLYNPSTKKVTTSRNVRFDEEHIGLPDPKQSSTLATNSIFIDSDDDELPPLINDSSDSDDEDGADFMNDVDDNDFDVPPLPQRDPPLNRLPARAVPAPAVPVVPPAMALRRFTRVPKPSVRLLESQQCNVAHTESNEPSTFSSAVQGADAAQWKEAMDKELSSLVCNNTWNLVPLPPGRKPIQTRWVFKIKYKADGSIERYKARHVAKGFSQHYGVDYDETFAPVARFSSVRTLLAITAFHDLELHQMDVDTAFLYGELKEDIYLTQPEGFEDPQHPDYVCYLNKSLYGLKQAPRVWNETLDAYLLQIGFTCSTADPCIYIRRNGVEFIILSVYVDDLLICSTSTTLVDELKAQLSRRFNMKDLGEAHYCLGLEILRDRDAGTLTIRQNKYSGDTLKQFNMQDASSVSTPLPAGHQLVRPDAPTDSVHPYRQAVGRLMYSVMGTRPDIAFAVSLVSRFLSNWDDSHWQAVKHILRYVKGTQGHGITYDRKSVSSFSLIGYCDADWGGDIEDRKSMTGYLFLLCGAPISWMSKKQSTIALSSTEAEYLAATHATKEAIWLRHLLLDLGFVPSGPTTIFEDNQSCIAIARNPAHHARTKHFDIQHHFVREKMELKEVDLVYCPTSDMLADMLTKALPRIKHLHLRSHAGILPASNSAH